MTHVASALACSNIALVKYWGKADVERNLTAVPSLSLTLAALTTRTRVEFDPNSNEDTLEINGSVLDGTPVTRAVRLLDEVRSLARIQTRARVTSFNDFPTASGLASSASGFAALALAACAAAGVELPPSATSSMARRASASAARSVFGGFVELLAGAEAAQPLVDPEYLDVAMIIAATTLGPKAVGSTSGMLNTQRTSPYYPAWVASAEPLFREAKAALLAKDLERLGEAMEASTLAMHACMLAARPSLCYLRDSTLSLMEEVRRLRSSGVAAFFTMDAGPHVKVLVSRADSARVRDALAAVPGVERVIVSGPGAAAHVLAPSVDGPARAGVAP
ncbi:MAG TPA: diphosphomevalonate decarboxylase [Polyangiaceae bacterium]|nr:diphosphomevalonate decarboxylase [Polyangiaceae bacterium]